MLSLSFTDRNSRVFSGVSKSPPKIASAGSASPSGSVGGLASDGLAMGGLAVGGLAVGGIAVDGLADGGLAEGGIAVDG
eukprot:564656-Pyramimonas_sp.AAC.1